MGKVSVLTSEWGRLLCDVSTLAVTVAVSNCLRNSRKREMHERVSGGGGEEHLCVCGERGWEGGVAERDGEREGGREELWKARSKSVQ